MTKRKETMQEWELRAARTEAEREDARRNAPITMGQFEDAIEVVSGRHPEAANVLRELAEAMGYV